ncbi:hypothetical protein ACFXPA_27475 [Amycolatopsis sp. NPDC059090]|uniref:hypothetical protein n=1 Tax=unclassified Amycolatopsis TaxID=2618356 RepID=UPI00366D18F7
MRRPRQILVCSTALALLSGCSSTQPQPSKTVTQPASATGTVPESPSFTDPQPAGPAMAFPPALLILGAVALALGAVGLFLVLTENGTPRMVGAILLGGCGGIILAAAVALIVPS